MNRTVSYGSFLFGQYVKKRPMFLCFFNKNDDKPNFIFDKSSILWYNNITNNRKTFFLNLFSFKE